MNTEILNVSSKGQIVLPINIRKRLSIDNKTKLAANVTDDIIMLKIIDIPTENDFSKSLDKAKKWAKEVGYNKEDIDSIIKSKRRGK